MSPEAQLARLALRLLANNPTEMMDVLADFSQEMLERARAIQEGNPDPMADREHMVQDFLNRFGDVIPLVEKRPEAASLKVLERELSRRMSGLPKGATFKLE